MAALLSDILALNGGAVAAAASGGASAAAGRSVTSDLRDVAPPPANHLHAIM